MKEFEPRFEPITEKTPEEPESAYRALEREKEKGILAGFTPEQQAEIEQKQQILSSLAYFIGKDFRIPVELNDPGAGWHWDFESNVIRIDPKDLLEKPTDYLRFVISHEGGHRRISRSDSIPLEEWKQPGFSFMMNAIEDPRDNNFVAEAYPKFQEQMGLAYQQDLDFEAKAKQKADQKLGYQPRFMQAGFEYIKQWFREIQGQEIQLSKDLPAEVKAAVKATLESARDSWWRYPSRKEADGGGKIGRKKVDGETMIREYAHTSYEINRDEIWPEFKKLVAADLEDQKTQELLQDMQEQRQKGAEGGERGLPRNLKDKLTPEEQQALEGAMQKAIEDAQKEKEQKAPAQKDRDEKKGETEGAPQPSEAEASASKPVDLRTLPEELKQKIRDYAESLPEERQKEIAEKAGSHFKEFEDALNEEMQGKLSDNPEKKGEREEIRAEEAERPEVKGKGWEEKEKENEEEARERRKRMEALFEAGEKDPYHEALGKVSGLIDALTSDLRDVFVKRKTEKYETGYRSGRRWNVRQRIREKVAGIPLLETEAREQKEAESEEMDYAITLLADLSGSMRNNGKIQEAFKSAVVLSETLNNLGIKFEIVGFQDVLLEFKSFEERMDEPMRERLNQMILEVYGDNPGGHNNPGDNDDGVCLLEASKRLSEQISKNKFLIVISDGIPETHDKSQSQLDRELREAVAEISGSTDQKIIGLGLNSQAVAAYYENHIAGITTEEMVETLGELLREVIEKY